MKKALYLTSIIELLISPASVFAFEAPGGGGGPGPVAPTGCSSFISCISTITDPTGGQFGQGQGLPARIITAFLPIVLTVAGFIAVIIIVLSGIQFITSSGNPEAANSARSRLIYALIGFGLIVLAFAILQIVDKIFLGTNIA